MTVSEFSEKYAITPIVMADGEREITGGYVGDLLSWVMGRAQADSAWITIMSNINIAAVAALTDVSCIILAEGVTLEDKVIDVARDKEINLLGSEHTAYELAGMLYRELN